MVIIPMLTCAVSERRSKLRNPLNPDGGLLKFLSTYPSNMKVKSVPHCVKGDFGGGAGVAACAGAAGAWVVGVCGSCVPSAVGCPAASPARTKDPEMMSANR